MELNLTAIKKMNIVHDSSSLVWLLEKTRLFNDIDPVTIHSLLSHCATESHDTWATILTEWEESNSQAYIILSGNADVYIGELKVSSLTTGEIFREYALICEEPRSATVRATTRLECLVLDESKVLQITDETNKLNDILTERILENSWE